MEKKNQLSLIIDITFKKATCCSQCYYYRIVRIFHAYTYPEESSRLRQVRHRRFHNGYD